VDGLRREYFWETQTMTGPNYVKHFTVLGKLAYLYDHAGA